jgi:hypothetical protein
MYGVVVKKYCQPRREWNDAIVFQFIIPFHEFENHPHRICADPKSHGKVVNQFRENMAISPGDVQCNDERWKYHGNPERLKANAPADVFYQPKQNVHVFQASEAQGYRV